MTGICVIPHGDKQPEAIRGHICDICYRHTEQQLASIHRIVEWLHVNIAAGGTNTGEPVTGSKEPPVPLRLDILDTIDDITVKLWSWVRLIAEKQGHARRADDPTLERIIATLQHALPWIAAQPWVDEFLLELDTTLRTAHQLAPWRPGRHRLPAPCPSCDMLTLTRRDGADHVTCNPQLGGCGRQWTEQDYARLTIVLASEQHTSQSEAS